jgi:hypothetical protein
MSRLSLFGRDMDGNEPKFLGWAEYSSASTVPKASGRWKMDL